MAVRYLLPCRCGEKLVVTPPQAGETLTCSCGATLQAPTMLEMASLELAPVAPATASDQTAWNWRRAAVLLGVVLVAAAVAAAAFLYFWLRPIPPADLVDPEKIREAASRFTPLETWNQWEAMKRGLGRTDPRYAAAMVIYHGLYAIPGILALLGAAAIIAAKVAGRKPARTPPAPLHR